ncbi:MAG TPA: hypothetical protein VJR02_27215, partial [Pyrinomonadaceae bacterium]|nr:hypothetical protein [Pyrinomonadaceae bacterium]
RIRERRRTNLHAAEDRVHEAWNKRALRGRAITEGHEKLFKWMLRDVVFGREDRQQAYSRSGQSDKWERENLKRTWLEGQKGDVVFAAMNYWNEATHAQGGRVFADWLSDPLLQEVPYDIWRERSEEYLKLTSEARKNSPKYYTLNDFLFDQAPRKEILEWRGYDWQIFPRSQDNPIDWVVEPPSVTPDVRRTLFKEIEHENLSVLNDGLAAECVRKIEHSVRVLKKALQQHLDHYSKKFEYEAANPGSKISSGLGLYDGDFGSLERVLKRLSDDVASIEDPGDSEVESSQEVTAEYLIRLAIYLNARMNTTEKDFLGVSKCAFITWALYHYYGPEALPLSEPADQRKKRWHFYSIPIHIPLPAQEGIQRTSILSLCTKNRLTDEELRLWRDVGSEIVLSTMMIDQHEEIRVSERERIRAGMAVGLYHQLGQVLYSVRARVRGLITEGQQLYDEITNIGEERTLDEVTQFAISKWPEHRDFSIRRLERLQLFRNFAFGQLTGVVENRNYASAKSVAEEALEQAKEYLLDDVPAGINLEFDDTLAQHVVNQDAYGFILQEIIANALRGASGPKPWVRINVTVEGNKAFINVTNSVSKEVYRKLKENPPEPSKEPGPERQSGRGLFGVYCLFQARRIEAPERIGPCKSREKFWFGFRCPIIDFYSASARQ